MRTKVFISLWKDQKIFSRKTRSYPRISEVSVFKVHWRRKLFSYSAGRSSRRRLEGFLLEEQKAYWDFLLESRRVYRLMGGPERPMREPEDHFKTNLMVLSNKIRSFFCRRSQILHIECWITKVLVLWITECLFLEGHMTFSQKSRIFFPKQTKDLLIKEQNFFLGVFTFGRPMMYLKMYFIIS